ncbi:MAG: diaminopimelate decarboxylase [Actinomycetia bacterium]|nr:diaminopimelate decarboxylase [Actinomycetes bacterium]MCP5031764.1 diaminopimelate decarboxylase [Actinomycetes bacterium]
MSPIPWSLLPDNASVGPTGQLLIGGCDTLDLAYEFGTPLFIYDEEHLRARCAEAFAAFGPSAVYASKAFLCRAMAQLAHEEGLGIDVASGGEIYICLSAGVPASRLAFHGNNKSMAELRHAIEVGVGRIVVDSFDELDRLDALAAAGVSGADGAAPKVLLRVTPGVKAETHDYIATGQDDSKFGFTVSTGLAATAVERARASESVDLVGVHAHIGSQVFRVDSFAAAVDVVGTFANPLGLEELVVGGGLGVAYVEGEEAPTITQWSRIIAKAAADAGITATIGIEPGRSIAAAAAVTFYTVGTVKDLPGIRTYISVDGGMSDNPRPVLYGSGYETFLPRAVTADRGLQARLVGKHCESGDLLVREASLPDDLEVGDVVATPVTGAYGHSMGSNYNKILRPPVVFCRQGDARLVVRRETYDDLLATDVG